MTFLRWDRNYYFAFFATAAAIVGYVVVLVVPLIETVDAESGEVVRRTLIADGEYLAVLLSVVPLALARALRGSGPDFLLAVYAIAVVVFFSLSTGKLAT